MIPVSKPFINGEVTKYAKEALDSGWISSQGIYVDLATEALSKFTGISYVLLTNNGTSAMHLVAKCLQEFIGTEQVAVPDNVYVAAWNTMLQDNYYFISSTPTDINTWNVDEEKLIEKKPKIALIVHNLGNIVSVDRLKKELPNTIFVEDNCEGFCHHNPMSESSFCSGISFYGNKIISCFPAGTKVCVKNNGGSGKSTVKNIENIYPGDFVWSRDLNGNKEYDFVTNIKKTYTNVLYKIKLANGNYIETTPEHKVFVHNKGWVEAEKLLIGDLVIQYNYHGLDFRIRNLNSRGKTYTELFGEENSNKRKNTHSETLIKIHANCNSKFNDSNSLYVRKQIDRKERLRIYNLPENKETRNKNRLKKVSESFKQMWLDPTYRQKTIEKVNAVRNTKWYQDRYNFGLNKRINRAEAEMLHLLDVSGLNNFKFNGRGECSVYFGGSAPDFVDVKQKKVIYFNGCYWHCCEECNIKNTRISEEEKKLKDTNIVKLAEQSGYQVLTVWEHELKNLELLTKKLLNFNYNTDAEVVEVASISINIFEIPVEVFDITTEKNHNFFANGILVHNCGEGGAFLTRDEKVYRFAKKTLGQGQSDIRFVHDIKGVNYRMTNVQAALLLGQLENYPESYGMREKVFANYEEKIKTIPNVIQQKYFRHSKWMFGVRVIGSKYQNAEKFFTDKGIEIRPMFYPMSAHRHLKVYARAEQECNAKLLNQECIILPTYSALEENQQEYIINTLREYVSNL